MYINGLVLINKVKEYIHNKEILIYEGVYFNLKKMIKEKNMIPDDGNLIFEGEYLNSHKRREKLFLKMVK